MATPSPADYEAAIGQLGFGAGRVNVVVLPTCESTNAVLLARAEQGAPSGTLIITENQTAGRGRRGRSWISKPGDSLTLSLLWRFGSGHSPVGGLSLAVGLAVARAVDTTLASQDRKTHETRVRLKWPNDVLLGGKKLGGILVELVPGASDAAVIGIGINLNLPESMPADIRASATALSIPDIGVRLFALIACELIEMLDQFSKHGFVAMREEWLDRHVHQNTRVALLSDFAPPRTGLCRGVDIDGALLLETPDGQTERVISGEVSLRDLQ